jgi:drug/metabolite transporter (DMT)-like permease
VKSQPFLRGSALAVLSAALFGVTTPLVRHFGAGVGAFATACFLYAGAALGAGPPRRRTAEPSIGSAQLPRIALVAAFGAALAPAALAWGLQRVGALTSSLLLNLEALFTVGLARALYGERIGPRAALAVSAMLVGGGILALRAGESGEFSVLGLGAVIVATLFWALDNTLTRPLADFDPRAVVFWKATLGAALSALAAVASADHWPRGAALLGLLACGMTGYGLSLRLYLTAQRAIGAARTGSLFAVGPFVGAALAFALGDRAGGTFVLFSALLFSLGVYLHLSEGHRHRHTHEALEHEHAHRHDDGHHQHEHHPPVTGSHSHRHRHDPTEHDHPHASDIHHHHQHH